MLILLLLRCIAIFGSRMRIHQFVVFAFVGMFALDAVAATNEVVVNGGFENGFNNWTRWGPNAGLITLDHGAHSGTNCARIGAGKNALYFNADLSFEKAYEIAFLYRLEGANPARQLSISFTTEDGGFRSAGFQSYKIEAPTNSANWAQFRQTFVPTATAVSGQFTFAGDTSSTLWVDDVSLREVPRPTGLATPAAPWEGLNHRTARPLFEELLTSEPGHYTVVSWAHDLNPKKKKGGFKRDDLKDDSVWQKEAATIFKEAGNAGMGFMDLPGRLNGTESWRSPEFHRDQFRKYGVKFDVWTEGSESTAAAIRSGAELLNPSGENLGRKPNVSVVDRNYVDAQEKILRNLGRKLTGEPFVGYYYGKDEPKVHIPEGKAERWGAYGQAMAKEVRAQYGFDRFDAPEPKDKDFQKDPNKPLRWIAYNRWANDRFIETRRRLNKALHEADPSARYTAANYWFMSGFVPFDYTRLAACGDLMECDPYASSAEKERGRGVFNHGFGAKFMSDLTGKPVRIIAQAFDYAGYKMKPDDLREWVSQAMRCGASAIDYYEMDSPRWSAPDRWKTMLNLSHTITRMNRIKLPTDADTAIIYTVYTHMGMGSESPGDQLYAAHLLLGEFAGSWFQFVSDTQLERGEIELSRYKTIYLPVAKYMTSEATAKIESAVRAGATLICGDAEAFSCDLAGNDTSARREQILGIKTLGAKSANKIVMKQSSIGLTAKTELPLFGISLWDESSPGHAREISVTPLDVQIIATYPDGTPAIVSRKFRKGNVVTFAANPFAPRIAVEKTQWPAFFKALQENAGCVVERPIWRFCLLSH